jgi:AAA+ ATPase superfamily predicted ATPase
VLIDREAEMQLLDDCWARAERGEPQLAVVWGRRRTGKTFLLSHFVRSRRAVFFGATAEAEGVELRRLREAVERDLGPEAADLAGGGFASWEAALRFFAALARHQPLAVVLDEVPYLAASTPGLPSIVQVVWDHLAPGTRLLLVLTGSAVGMVERMLGAGGALFGRPTLRIRLDPLDLVSARAFLPDLDPAAYVEAYAACGGYPLHLRAWDQGLSTGENLERLAATPGGLLLEDAAGILAEDLPAQGGYARVLAAIGRGRTRLSDIAAEAQQRVEGPVEVLVRTGFVRRSLPVAAPGRARPLYEIGDVYLGFWFGVLYPELQQIAAGLGPQVLQRRAPQWQRHLGWVFEEGSRAHAVRLVQRGRLPRGLVIGRWWTASGPPCEVDVLGLQGGRTALLGEARWQAKPLDIRDLMTLMAKVTRVPDPIPDPLYALWGRNGVDARARAAGVLGFDVQDVIEP